MKIEITLSPEERRRCRDKKDVFRETLLHELGTFVYGRAKVRLRIYNERHTPLLVWDPGEPWPPHYRDDMEELQCPECGKRHIDEGALAQQRHWQHRCVEDAAGVGCGHVWRLDRCVWGAPLALAVSKEGR